MSLIEASMLDGGDGMEDAFDLFSGRVERDIGDIMDRVQAVKDRGAMGPWTEETLISELDMMGQLLVDVGVVMLSLEQLVSVVPAASVGDSGSGSGWGYRGVSSRVQRDRWVSQRDTFRHVSYNLSERSRGLRLMVDAHRERERGVE